MNVLLARFDAPLMSFGDVIVDQHNITDHFPRLSQLTGLLGNALGYNHKQADLLETFQSRIEYAARWDVEPQLIVDYQTVDLGQKKMRSPGWTTWGKKEWRAGGPAKTGIHQRYRHYLSGGVMTLAISLKDDGIPSIIDLADALRQPARPLFIGRKTCLPAAPLYLGMVKSENVYTALCTAPLSLRAEGNRLRACWSSNISVSTSDRSKSVRIYDRRDWTNQVHTGSRTRIEGLIEVNPT